MFRWVYHYPSVLQDWRSCHDGIYRRRIAGRSPYVTAAGNRPNRQVSTAKARRRGFSSDAKAVKRTKPCIVRADAGKSAAAAQEQGQSYPEVQLFVDFIAAAERSIIR